MDKELIYTTFMVVLVFISGIGVGMFIGFEQGISEYDTLKEEVGNQTAYNTGVMVGVDFHSGMVGYASGVRSNTTQYQFAYELGYNFAKTNDSREQQEIFRELMALE